MRRSTTLLAVLVFAVATVACSTSGDGGAAPATSDATDRTPTTDRTGDDATDEPTTSDRAPSRFGDLASSDLTFRPVLAVAAPASDGGAPTCEGVRVGRARGAQVAETTTTASAAPPPGSDVLAGTGDQVCYLVGPVAADGGDLAGAKAGIGSDGNWMVTVRPRSTSVDDLNALFDACYEATATCPPVAGEHGAVAVVIDGEVVSAPTVNGEDLADEAFQISGSFTEAEARDLAAALTR